MAKSVTELFDLTGKTAIVTGGSRGIGKELAEGLAEAGANLMLCARRGEWLGETVAEFENRGFNVGEKMCDGTKADKNKTVVEETIATVGSDDILVNNLS